MNEKRESKLMGWNKFETRMSELETKRKPSRNRRAVFELIKNSILRPHPEYDASLYLGPLVDPRGQPVCFEYTNDRPNLWFHESHVGDLRAAGLAPECKPPTGIDSEGRHHGLKSKGFRDVDAWKLGDLDPDTTKEALVALGLMKVSDIDQRAVDRWIARLREFFPDLDRFDWPDPDFDAREREYKLEFTDRLKTAFKTCETPISYLDSFLSEAKKQLSGQKYNLIDWRPLDLVAKHPRREDMGRAIVNFLKRIESDQVDDTKLCEFMQEMSDAWSQGNQSSWDPARQVAEAIAFHLCSRQAIFFRRGVLDPFFEEAAGSNFPHHDDPKESYAEELRFARAVYKAFEERGLAPRDMIDIQSALWVVHNYKDEKLTREKIEKAMDAYEGYLKTGEGSEIFDGFKQPKGFWVRSTRSRPNRVFPSKPIVAHALGVEQLNGGWSSGASAAAALHNAGYIIVDQDDQPVPIPPDKPFLLIDADRIRACALNYYIFPAREQGEAQASIRAGTLNNELMLKEAWPNICQALKGRKFQELAGVSKPTQEGPDASTTTIFTYNLPDDRKNRSMGNKKNEHPQVTTNLILYGPPGTGKTYKTAWEAVQLCLGEVAAEPLQGPKNRSALMSTYHKLVDEGRIEFVTFHQSYSYEDFVEGLRPVTGNGQDENTNTGFRLESVPGIMQRISKRAEIGSRAVSAGDSFSVEGRQLFQMSLGEIANPSDAAIFDEAMAEDCILLGFENTDWSDQKYSNSDEIANVYKEVDEDKDPKQSGPYQSVNYFRNMVKIGDIIVVSKGNKKFRAIAEVLGDYEYRPRSDVTYSHRRKVRWLWNDPDGVPVNEISEVEFNAKTIYLLKKENLNIPALERYMNPQISKEEARPEPFVLIIDEINRANISKVFGELITLLEPDKRLGALNEIRVQLPYSKKRFGVPQNLHIIGTMNTADRSIALLDTALRRRFAFRELMPDAHALTEALAESDLDADNLDGIRLCKLLATINGRIEYLFDREHQIGHAYFTGCRSRADIEDVMRNKIIPLLAEYFYEDWSKVAAVLGDGSGAANAHFLEARKLSPPAGFDNDELGGEKLRWSVKAKFDFSEFEA